MSVKPAIDWPAPPFDPAQCRGEKCSYTKSFDHETGEPRGPQCGRAATQVIFWRDRRFSPSCESHGLRALDADTIDKVLCVHPFARLLVCGNRDFFDAARIAREIEALAPLFVIHGAAPGADTHAGIEAMVLGCHVLTFPVDHAIDGPWPGAGPRRNARMLRDSKPDRGLAFGALWKRDGRMNDPEAQAPLWKGARSGGWKTTGAGGMVSLMLAAGLPVRWIASPNADAIDLDGMPGPP